ncbi:MAG: aminotransferase class IV [Candidatus Omnitrophota bacterium]
MVFLDGKWLSEKEAKARIYEPGFLYGQGVFETMLARGGNIFRLEAHLSRLCKSAGLVGINLEYPWGELKDMVTRAVKMERRHFSYVRLTVWAASPGSAAHISLVSRDYRPYSRERYLQGFAAVLSRMRQNEFSFLSNIKSSCRLHLFLAELEAKDKRADEAILRNTRGNIAEGTRTNIFLVKDNMLRTPDISSGCLPGVMRETVMEIAAREKMAADEGAISLEELFGADEAFLTNSLIGVMPCTVIDGRGIGQGRPGRITQILMEKLEGYA